MATERVADVPETPGRHVAQLPVTVDLDGSEIAIWTHVLVGAKPGPTLLILSGAHGNEWGHIEFFHRFVDGQELRNTLREPTLGY